MTITLTYFDLHGSRGLECRLALAVAGLAFTDERLSREQWSARRASTPFAGLPVLTVDDRVLSQSNAILGWIGRGNGLHPADPWTAAEHDAVMVSVEDLRGKIPSPQSDDEKKVAREAFAAGWLTHWATTIDQRVAGPFLEGDRLQVADIKLYVILRSFMRGAYDHIPASFFDTWPKLASLYAAVEAHPAVHAHLAKH